MWSRKLVSALLFVSLFSALVFSQGVTTSREKTIAKLQAISAELVLELDKQVAISDKQKAELKTLKDRLISISDSLTKANADLIVAANSLACLMKDFEDYKKTKEAELQSARNEVFFWKVGAIGMALSFVGLAIYSAFK